MTRRIISTAVIAIATAALAAPAALARPADLPPAVAKTTAEQHKQASQYPTRPIIDRPSYPPSTQVTAATTTPEPPADSGVAWSMLGLGTAGLLAAAAIAAVVSRTRTGARTRITA